MHKTYSIYWMCPSRLSMASFPIEWLGCICLPMPTVMKTLMSYTQVNYSSIQPDIDTRYFWEALSKKQRSLLRSNVILSFAVIDIAKYVPEYHLGRKAFRLCKRGTKFCAWHRQMPNFYQWTHICGTYDSEKVFNHAFLPELT